MTLRYTLRFLLFTVLIGFFSCGSDPDPASDTSQTNQGIAPESVSLQLDAEPDQLNPVLTISNYSNTIIGAAFSYLQRLNPTTLELEPALAVSAPEVTILEEGPYAGGVSYTFEIRPEAVWDNGSPVTAEDFLFTMKATFNPKVPAAPYRVYLSFIKEVEIDAENPKRFTVYSDQKYIIGEEAISAALPVLPMHHYDSLGLMADIPLSDLMDTEKAKALAESNEKINQFAEQFTSSFFSREPEGVNGCGPYKLVRWETGQRLVLERKADWWGDQVEGAGIVMESYPQKMIFRPIQDQTAAVAALKDGQLDVLANIAPEQFNELKETAFVAEKFDFYTPPSLVHAFIYVNTRLPKLEDPRVRRALAYATDVESMINTAFSGLAEPSTGSVLASSSYHNPDIKPIPYEVEKARALLTEAGWEDSNDNGIVDKEIDGVLTELSLEYKYTAGRQVSQNVALLLQESAKKAGIEITLTPQEHNVNMEDVSRRDFELLAGAKGIQPITWEPKQEYHSEGDDRSGFATPETDALIDRIQVTLDPKERKKLYMDLQAKIHESMPIIPILVPTGRLIINKELEAPITPVFPGYVPALLKFKTEG
jgi:peptide/nickel transport system substrate-binding protein